MEYLSKTLKYKNILTNSKHRFMWITEKYIWITLTLFKLQYVNRLSSRRVSRLPPESGSIIKALRIARSALLVYSWLILGGVYSTPLGHLRISCCLLIAHYICHALSFGEWSHGSLTQIRKGPGGGGGKHVPLVQDLLGGLLESNHKYADKLLPVNMRKETKCYGCDSTYLIKTLGDPAESPMAQ